MKPGIQIQAIWNDVDMTEISVRAWNGAFGGVMRIYVGLGNLKEAAERLHGFPKSPADLREITFGQFNLEPARLGKFDIKTLASGVRMRFRCVNAAGHAYLDARLQSDIPAHTSLGPGERPEGTLQAVDLVMRVEATAVDSFVEELLRLESNRTGTAHLRAIDGDRTESSE